MGQINTIINSGVAGVQILGGGFAIFNIARAAFSYFKGGREGVEHGKDRLQHTVIGMVALAGATVIGNWLNGIISF